MKEVNTLDYRHSFHAGNVGDVWKHMALVSLLDTLLTDRRSLDVLDTHAGDGSYRFQSTGEWTAGIGRLWEHGPTKLSVVDRYVERVAKLTNNDRRSYPGSPALIIDSLRSTDTATFCETRPEASVSLQRVIGARGKVIEGDGYKTLASGGVKGSRWLVHIDPPYAEKEEWNSAPDAIARAAAGGAVVIAWYPIKSLSRPNVMLARLREKGTPAVAIELCVTPLELKRPALAGSGLVFVNAPASVLAEVHSAASVLGPICATHQGRWFVRTTAWGTST
jgi:23S rRNA (adenine2030-N6)-methyltransferase